MKHYSYNEKGQLTPNKGDDFAGAIAPDGGWVEDENGTVIAGRKPVGKINVAPTWTGMLPSLLTLYESSTPEGRAVALEELQRMAKIADGARS